MKAEDTIMAERDTKEFYEVDRTRDTYKILKAQAEISFKAGVGCAKDSTLELLRSLADEDVSLCQAIDILKDTPS